MQTDSFDLTQDGVFTGSNPDLLLEPRIVGDDSDMGGFESIEYVAACCPGDVNFDNTVNVTDLLAVISAWGPCGSPCPADVAPSPCKDGQVNVTDLLMVIDRWGDCENCFEEGVGYPIPYEEYMEACEICDEFTEGTVEWALCIREAMCNLDVTEYCDP